MIFPLKELNTQIQTFDQDNGLISIWGEFGVGKTTFALQTALSNCTPLNYVIFIYTKPNLPLKSLSRISQKFKENNLNDFLLYKILDFSELYDFIHNFGQIVAKVKKNREDIKILIIIDSITNLYQIELRKNSKNKNVTLNYKLNQILATLKYLKLNYTTEILMVNNIRSIRRENQTIEIPAGGKVMDFWLGYSIKIERDKKLNYRKIILSNRTGTKQISTLTTLTKLGFEQL